MVLRCVSARRLDYRHAEQKDRCSYAYEDCGKPGEEVSPWPRIAEKSESDKLNGMLLYFINSPHVEGVAAEIYDVADETF